MISIYGTASDFYVFPPKLRSVFMFVENSAVGGKRKNMKEAIELFAKWFFAVSSASVMHVGLISSFA